jgi:uncharacterized membrane protein YtjA (UPF0391 family)
VFLQHGRPCARAGLSRPVERGAWPIASSARKEEISVLTWALIFLVVAIIAGILGFGGIASTATGIAKVLFFVFLILLVVTTIASFAA